MPTFHWDFFGGDAQETAEHFRRHLDGFLAREQLAGCVTGTASEQAGHHGAWCRAPEALEDVLVRSLGPRRKT